ncbi:MAG: MBL fold metallo-hydrolase, partial [Ktedonobacteraceae bacterium]|nr:MBL fold metallo-hydrolase [Ktedonobacteraceae bacterium]
LNGHVLFTGDTLFLTGVGRPDLAADQQEAMRRADALYESLHRLLALPTNTMVLPGHTSVPIPFDGVPIVAQLAEIERRVDMLHTARANFVRELLVRLPAPPSNYERIVKLNERGTPPQVPTTELEAGANRCAVS